MHCLLRPCSKPLEFYENLTLVYKHPVFLYSYQEITHVYALHVHITPHHPQLRAAFLSWREPI